MPRARGCWSPPCSTAAVSGGSAAAFTGEAELEHLRIGGHVELARVEFDRAAGPERALLRGDRPAIDEPPVRVAQLGADVGDALALGGGVHDGAGDREQFGARGQVAAVDRLDRTSTRLNYSHSCASRMPPSARKKKTYQ